MGRSLYRKLHRRFGRRLSGTERKRRTDFAIDRLRTKMPAVDAALGKKRIVASPPTLAIVGGGFAGSMAAYAANNYGFAVTVYDPQGIGGRVQSSQNVVQGRILETGAELIGSNHPLWVMLAQNLGLGLSGRGARLVNNLSRRRTAMSGWPIEVQQ